MNITREADYALRVISLLSEVKEDTIISASKISDSEKIPSQFLLKILRKLRKASLVKSYMGVNGGYKLNKPSKDISLKDVIESIDGPIYINRCLYNPEDCNRNFSSECRLHYHLGLVEDKLLKDLDDITFDIISNTVV